ncbi:nitroreductase family protein [Salisediminibacterium selenitireducens]|uniref:Nitroreductase n=1 Tax=Bacillus selenitireducens (strain ATCC 700615 / DSM 15326 / MLS10) TaxID=439292 RepID=D6XYP8_BACIE|nr:nitroreductase family protein [Salisediminibacterium selenitireducens]ADH98206.1 nitroreductase [[Bacillus] selenitireducens MLS10]
MEKHDIKTDAGLFRTMEERHSVKSYQTGVTIPDTEIRSMIEMATEAPSSWNLQHWKFLVVDDEEQKEKLHRIAYGQNQVKECSVVIAVLGDTKANEHADRIFQEAVDKGLITEAVKEKIVNGINGAYNGSETFPRDEAFLNASLAAMQLMLSARGLGYDTCPMGGFDREAFVEEFNVPERYVPVMLLTVGVRAEEPRISSRLSVDEAMVRNTF